MIHILLKINYLDIYSAPNINLCVIDFFKYNKFKLMANGAINYDVTEFKEIDEEPKQKLDKIPEILVLFHSFHNDSITGFYNSYYNKYITEFKKDINYNIKNYDISSKDISECKDVIIFNGIEYKLDACLLGNYSTYGKHMIAGIHCEGKQYVYNGWTKNTIDPSFINEGITKNNLCFFNGF